MKEGTGMGTDDLFKKRRAERQQRKYEYKNPKVNSYLIITEGERTEPLYFRGLKKLIQEKVGGAVDIVEAPRIDIHGEGCATGKLIEIADQKVKDAKIIYQNIWVVFDKDDFADFDQAIEAGTSRGYHIAWSNQSFEYWLYLHFCYADSALHREDWASKLSDIFKQYGLGDGTYKKNYEEIYALVNRYDGVNAAIKNAKRRMAGFEKSGKKASEYDPGTKVHVLVENLKQYLENEI